MKNFKIMKNLAGAAIALGALGFTTQASAAQELIINEYNGVGPEQKLDECDDEGDHMFGCVVGNGENWIELVVTQDGLDIEDWTVQWKNADSGGHTNNGYFTFVDPPNGDAGMWNNLDAGTVIVVQDSSTINVRTPTFGGASAYNPCAGDSSRWLIVVDATDPDYIVSDTFDGSSSQGPGLKTDNDCWRGRIMNNTTVVQSWVGENQGSNPSCPGSLGTATWNGGGISNNEVGKLESNPVAPGAGTNTNYKDGDSSTFGGPNVWSAGTGIQSLDALCNVACGVVTGCCDSTSTSGSFGGAAGLDCYERNFSYYY